MNFNKGSREKGAERDLESEEKACLEFDDHIKERDLEEVAKEEANDLKLNRK